MCWDVEKMGEECPQPVGRLAEGDLGLASMWGWIGVGKLLWGSPTFGR